MEIPYLSLKQVSAQHFDEYSSALNRVLDSGWFLQGKENAKFEENYAKYIGTKYCVGVANGLDALILSLLCAIELGKMHTGDEVIVPANTYIATILAITKAGLTPVLVEPDISTFQIDDSLIESHITNKTKAIMLVHLYGRCAYTEKIEAICQKYGLLLFEDNAQAHGCMFNGKKTGSFGFIAAHSFYPGKNLGAFGDGGAVTTNSKEAADLIRTLANYGSSKKYVFDYIGQNSRLDETNAAVLDVKLKYLDEDNQKRKEIAKIFIENIKNEKIALPKISNYDQNVFHIFPILCENRDELQAYLLKNGIRTMIHYPIPPHKQKCYENVLSDLTLPVTEKIHREELSLPLNQCLTTEEISYIIETVNNF